MKIAILQRDIEWCDVRANVHRADAAVDRLEGVDVVVLPEMFSTGFVMKPEGVAEVDGGESLDWMRRKARERDCALAGSVAVRTDGRYVNRFYFVTPEGGVSYYDKHHLFAYGGEDRSYSCGDEQVVVTFRGVRIRLLVCYDLRFPVWCRNRGDYDLALFVASWPSSRVDAWDALLRARAIENQCYVAGVNRVGRDPACLYCGSSAVVDPYGKVAAYCGRDAECAAVAEIDMEGLRAFRAKFPVLGDADGFELL